MSFVHRKRRRGFTLVELMTVVMLISMLLALATPNYVKAREAARTRACVSNMKKLESAAQQWAMSTKAAPGTAVTIANLVGTSVANSYIRVAPQCPSGSLPYAAFTVDTRPVCPINGNHVLP